MLTEQQNAGNAEMGLKCFPELQQSNAARAFKVCLPGAHAETRVARP